MVLNLYSPDDELSRSAASAINAVLDLQKFQMCRRLYVTRPEKFGDKLIRPYKFVVVYEHKNVLATIELTFKAYRASTPLMIECSSVVKDLDIVGDKLTLDDIKNKSYKSSGKSNEAFRIAYDVIVCKTLQYVANKIDKKLERIANDIKIIED